jgi:hypothetical protein
VLEHRLCAGVVQSLIQNMSVAANVMAVQLVVGAWISANVSKFTVYWQNNSTKKTQLQSKGDIFGKRGRYSLHSSTLSTVAIFCTYT